MPTALFLHHDANSSIGLLGPILRAEGYEIREHFICTELDSGVSAGPLPGLDGIDLLVPLGSRWSVYDRDNIGTWIDEELDLVRAADAASIPVLGVCFGGQLLAAALGGSVGPAQFEEIGWMDIELTTEGAARPVAHCLAPGPWFQWHLDIVEAPPGAEILAVSPAGPQAFALRRNLALQFHPEVDGAVLEEWMITDRDQLRDSGVDPDELLAETAAHTPTALGRTQRLVRAFLTTL